MNTVLAGAQTERPEPVPALSPKNRDSFVDSIGYLSMPHLEASCAKNLGAYFKILATSPKEGRSSDNHCQKCMNFAPTGNAVNDFANVKHEVRMQF